MLISDLATVTVFTFVLLPCPLVTVKVTELTPGLGNEIAVLEAVGIAGVAPLSALHA